MENTLSDLDDLLIQLGYLPYRGSTTSRTSTARSGTEYGVKSFARRPVTRPARASELTSLELCAGGGGQAIGLEAAGFRHLGLVELDRHAVATLRANSAKHRLGWNVIEADINRWDCTIFQYIGEFCRYLLHAAPSVRSQRHRIRLACGNGLTPDVWDDFKRSFRIPQILEFYAATEGAVSLFNAEGQPGAIGRVPPYLAHRFSPALVKFDVETGEPVRNEQGFCIRCDVNEAGEALARCHDDPAHLGSRFDGYTDTGASAKKILRDVFQPGDTWVRTGDLMRKDGRGFYYFVDRIGDTFRWKGENVATTEVAEVLCAFPGVQHASVYGVRIPDTEGRAGMAAIVADQDLDLRALREHLVNRLPTYARPLFVRRRVEIEVTGTFKYSKTELAREGYNPGNTTDAIYFNDPRIQEFRKLDARLHEQIQNGHLRL